MVKEDKATWKSNYFLKLTSLLDEYSKLFIVNVDNVGSKQMQNIRADLRGIILKIQVIFHLINIPLQNVTNNFC